MQLIYKRKAPLLSNSLTVNFLSLFHWKVQKRQYKDLHFLSWVPAHQDKYPCNHFQIIIIESIYVIYQPKNIWKYMSLLHLLFFSSEEASSILVQSMFAIKEAGLYSMGRVYSRHLMDASITPSLMPWVLKKYFH